MLGHADADHRGAAPAARARRLLPPGRARGRRVAVVASATTGTSPSSSRTAAALFPRLLPAWDGGAVQIAGTVEEGDEVAGFRVVELPGHAPGLIGLFRESDRLALVSDCFYTLDPADRASRAAARVPHPAFDIDTEQARASIRKLAALDRAVVWAGPRQAGLRRRRRRSCERAASARL